MGLVTGSIAAITRHYPLLSGTASIANSRPFCSLSRSIAGDAWVPVGKARVLVPVNDFVGRSIYFFGDLDPKITALARHCLEPGDCALDVGSNLGIVAIIMAQHLGPTGRVHAFEPAPRMAGYIARTLAANPALPVTLHQYGLGEAPATLDLHIPPGNAGAASFGPLERSTQSVTVEVKRLSDVVATEGIARIDFIKMDVEGFEAQVLRGSADLFKATPPKYIVFEEHGLRLSGRLPDSIAFLLDHGYRVFGISRSMLRIALEELTRDRLVHSWDYFAVSPAGMPKVHCFVKA